MMIYPNTYNLAGGVYAPPDPDVSVGQNQAGQCVVTIANLASDQAMQFDEQSDGQYSLGWSGSVENLNSANQQWNGSINPVLYIRFTGSSNASTGNTGTETAQPTAASPPTTSSSASPSSSSYAQCITSAGDSVGKLEKCALLLGGESPKPTAAGGGEKEFFSPSGNIECAINTNPNSAYCQTFQPPQQATLRDNGTVEECSGSRCPLGNPEGSKLGYGQVVSLAPFTCRSLPSGMECQLANGRGFVISRSGIRRVS